MSNAIQIRMRRIRDLTAELARETTALNRDLALQTGELGTRRPRIAIIQELVCEHYELPAVAMTTKARPRHYAHPRQLAMYFCREYTRYSLEEIADAFGGRDHATVTCACKSIKARMATEKECGSTVALLRPVVVARLASMDMPLFKTAIPA